MRDISASVRDSSGQALPPSDKTAISEQAAPATGISATAAQAKAPSRRSRGAAILLTLLLLLLIVGIGVLGWLHLEQRNVVAALQADVAALSQENAVSPAQLAALRQEQEQMLARLQETESAQQQLQTAVQQMNATVQQALQQEQQAMQQAIRQSQQASEQTLQENAQALEQANTRIVAQDERLDSINRGLVATNLRISDTGAGASQAWMLNEAESLMRLARQRLLVARDVRSAIALFVATDDLLQQLNDPSVSAVREMLAQELAILQGLPEVDPQGLYVQLGAQIERIDDFAVARESDNRDFTVQPVDRNTVVEAAGNWLDSLQNVVGRYFVVTQREDDITPLVTDEHAYLIRRSIQLQIEQARLALMRGEADLYQRALDEAINGIAMRLEEESGNKDELIATLNTLRDTPIAVTIPPLNATLTAIGQIVPAAARVPAESNP